MNNQKSKVRAAGEFPFFYGYVIAIACVVMTAISLGIYFSIGVFFKPMLNEFGWTRAATSGPISLSWIAGGLASILFGRLNDKIGPRVVVTICGLLFGVGYLLMSQVNSIWELFLYYGILIGSGMSISVALMSTIARWFVRRRTFMTGLIVSGVGLGGLFLAPLATWIINEQGWRNAFIWLGITNLVLVILGAQFLKRDPAQMNLQPYGVSQAQEARSCINTQGFSLQAALRTWQFWLIFFFFFCFSFSINSTVVHIVPHITDLGISPENAALVLAAVNGVGIFGRIGLGSIGDRTGNKRVFILVFSMLAISFLWLIFTSDLWTFYIFAVVYGLAMGAGITNQSPIVANIFGMKANGIILGVINIGHIGGAAIGTVLSGYIFDISGNYQVPFAIYAIACVFGLILGLAGHSSGSGDKKKALINNQG